MTPEGAEDVIRRTVTVRASPDRAFRVFEHRNLARHGECGAEYRAALDSPQGWPYILDRYAAAVT